MRIFKSGAGHFRTLLLAAALLAFAAHGAAAQHHDHSHPQPTPTATPTATPQPTPRPSPTPAPKPPAGGAQDASHHAGAAADGQGRQHERHGEGDVRRPSLVGDPHEGHGAAASPMTSRDGSGTSWQPASTPSYMIHKRVGDWALMFHGEAKIGVNAQGGPRGVAKFESQNWFMPMATRKVGRGTLELRGMFSAEPLTYSGAGSPQLFQSGEVYQGRPIIDAQHPHDVLMELSAKYTLPVGERGSWFAYFGYPGEPALGPVAFMHRASAAENPAAPLAHHLQDSTHVAFGVFTTGFTYRWLKVEGSVFNGREPDEDRYGFEAGPWDSRSVRVSVAPNSHWVFQYY